MRVGIVTITEGDNFGNRLQNYALQTVLVQKGIEVETIKNYIVYRSQCKLKYKLKLLLKWVLKNDKHSLAILIKKVRFEKFDSKNFTFSKDYATKSMIPEGLNNHYNYFIAGSDQIWNPYFIFNFDFNFLQFADYEKRIAYAASFGVDKIPEEDKEYFSDRISSMRCVSTREYAGKEIVEFLSDKTCTVVLDPTLLLTTEEWRAFSSKPKHFDCSSPYILVYHLGDSENKKNVLEDLISKDKRLNYCKIFDLTDYLSNCFWITPDEFVWLIDHAELFVTDSFHGTVFSLLMGTAFFCTKRVDRNVSMNSRLESLFKMLDVNYKYGEVYYPQEFWDSFVEEKEKKRTLSLEFLYRSLKLDL